MFAIAGNVSGIVFGFLSNSLAVMLMNSVFALMYVRAYLSWGQEEGNTNPDLVVRQ